MNSKGREQIQQALNALRESIQSQVELLSETLGDLCEAVGEMRPGHSKEVELARDHFIRGTQILATICKRDPK